MTSAAPQTPSFLDRWFGILLVLTILVLGVGMSVVGAYLALGPGSEGNALVR